MLMDLKMEIWMKYIRGGGVGSALHLDEWSIMDYITNEMMILQQQQDVHLLERPITNNGKVGYKLCSQQNIHQSKYVYNN